MKKFTKLLASSQRESIRVRFLMMITAVKNGGNSIILSGCFSATSTGSHVNVDVSENNLTRFGGDAECLLVSSSLSKLYLTVNKTKNLSHKS